MSARAILLAACACLGGCISIVSVEKATPKSEGVRYFLPEVFIKVSLKPDGTLAVEPVYLPDPSNEYVVSAKSLFGNYTLDLNRTEEGFLGMVTMESDTSAVAKQLATSYGNVRAAQIDAQAAKAKADAAAAKDASDKAKAALDTADKARKDAGTAVDVAQRKLQLLQQRSREAAPPTDIEDQVLAARLALAEAEAKRDAAESAYASLLGSSIDAAGRGPAAASSLDEAREMKLTHPLIEQQPTAPGPMFYRVVMDEKSAGLVEAFPQGRLVTWQPPIAPDFDVLPASIVIRPESGTNALTATIKSNYPVIDVQVSRFSRGDVDLRREPLVALQSDHVSVKIDMPKDTPKGQYTLETIFRIGTPKRYRDEAVSLHIVVEK